ncbi:hypothetical protein PpBr36_04852 [Pyricularia pennisetigena]|uniref:hypothetical protein n=1 Tax=Pyricularia pennisetigena TaxID=1578925 RepID=UPI00114FB32F|nr:hypothetical protein PpBr36_04852 [Pyricularia pennisetigena]TLS26588.1 hypothetical protein PpBr36_04852 [Pyricularia pennisetigena]
MEIAGNVVPPHQKLQQLERLGGVDVVGGGNRPAQDGKLFKSKFWGAGRLAMALLASFAKASPTGDEREVACLKFWKPSRFSVDLVSELALPLRPPMEDPGRIQFIGLRASKRVDDFSGPGTGHVWDAARAVVCEVDLLVGAAELDVAAVEDCWRTIDDAAGVVLLMARRAAVTRVEDVAVRRALWTACRASIFCFGLQDQN